MSGYLTTHVLDTANGCPGSGIKLSLYRLDADERQCLVEAVTNADGRVDQPLLADEKFVTGQYELCFEAGDYYRARGTQLMDPAFLDQVVIRFGIAQSDAHYHVPLLVSPYGYSTYRGS